MGQRCSFRRARTLFSVRERPAACRESAASVPACVRPCVCPSARRVPAVAGAAGGSCPAIDRRPPPVTSAAPIGARRRPPRHWPERGAQRRAPPLSVATAATPRSPPLNLVPRTPEGCIALGSLSLGDADFLSAK